ncbi:hypothetical protein IW262DRAFT_1300818 [Armillaria fumosa]|nr:hypothetical protein IW262DRAFT_1300818 [Armillaria fumosa]
MSHVQSAIVIPPTLILTRTIHTSTWTRTLNFQDALPNTTYLPRERPDGQGEETIDTAHVLTTRVNAHVRFVGSSITTQEPLNYLQESRTCYFHSNYHNGVRGTLGDLYAGSVGTPGRFCALGASVLTSWTVGESDPGYIQDSLDGCKSWDDDVRSIYAATSPGAINNIREIKEVASKRWIPVYSVCYPAMGVPSKAQIMRRSLQQSWLPVQEHQRREEWGNKGRRLILSETSYIDAQIKSVKKLDFIVRGTVVFSSVNIGVREGRK